ncbi:MAG TPA: RluA family pseudouridine synthase [Solirubrobacteraceae bacterium]|nr:RluA family pseudouridine synthase [Solirubrobacteraceae bacterium]
MRLAEGARIAFEAPTAEDSPLVGEDLPLAVVFEDEHLIVIDKPAGLVVHPAPGHAAGTLVNALVGHCGGSLSGVGGVKRPGIVHRLDKDTSGLLVVAKGEEAHRRLKQALAARAIVREYLALVAGRPPSRAGTIDAPIGRDRRSRTRVSLDSATPRAARTHFELEQALPGASLLRVRLETGRTHQIRAHFEAIGHPVCGDPQYGGAPAFGLSRQFLHAAHIELAHPRSGEQLRFDSPLPADLAAALERARRVSS